MEVFRWTTGNIKSSTVIGIFLVLLSKRTSSILEVVEHNAPLYRVLNPTFPDPVSGLNFSCIKDLGDYFQMRDADECPLTFFPLSAHLKGVITTYVNVTGTDTVNLEFPYAICGYSARLFDSVALDVELRFKCGNGQLLAVRNFIHGQKTVVLHRAAVSAVCNRRTSISSWVFTDVPAVASLSARHLEAIYLDCVDQAQSSSLNISLQPWPVTCSRFNVNCSFSHISTPAVAVPPQIHARHGETVSTASWVVPLAVSIGLVTGLLSVYAGKKVVRYVRYQEELTRAAQRAEETQRRYRARYRNEQHARKINEVVVIDNIAMNMQGNSYENEHRSFGLHLLADDSVDTSFHGILNFESMPLRSNSQQRTAELSSLLEKTGVSSLSTSGDYDYIDTSSVASLVPHMKSAFSDSIASRSGTDADQQNVYEGISSCTISSPASRLDQAIATSTPNRSSTVPTLCVHGNTPESVEEDKYISVTDVYSYAV